MAVALPTFRTEEFRTVIIYYSGADQSYGEATDKITDNVSVMMTYAKIGFNNGPRFWDLVKRRKETAGHVGAGKKGRGANQNQR